MAEFSKGTSLHLLLERKFEVFNSLEFIEEDPIRIPHGFSRKEDIEISGFLAATLAWGQRKTILKNAHDLMTRIDNAPYDFVINAAPNDYRVLRSFKHRTFNGEDAVLFLKALKYIYEKKGGLEAVYEEGYRPACSVFDAIAHFRKIFFETFAESRTGKHVAHVSKGSAAKRINMFLRWMVRSDDRSVDFGLWKKIQAANLMIPLDVHTGNVARSLGLLKRSQNDWKAVEELTTSLKQFDKCDPVKYDFALFGMGVNQHML